MKKLCVFLTILFGLSALSGCVVRPHPIGAAIAHAIIPLAPVHGYRYHQHGRVLIFDARLGVYAVDGYPGTYFYDGRYFQRNAAGHWVYSSRFKGPWLSYTNKGRLPRGFTSHMKTKQRIRENRRDDRRDNVRENRRDDRRDNVRENRRDDRRDNVRENRRDDRRDNVRENRRDDRRDEGREDNRDDRRDEGREDNRDDRRDEGYRDR